MTPHDFDSLAELHQKSLLAVTKLLSPTLLTLPGDVAAAVNAATATLFLAALNEHVR